MLRLSFGKKMFTCSSLLTVPYWLTGVKQYWVLISSDWNIALHELDSYQRGWLRHEALALVSFFRSAVADANTSETLLRLLFICLNTIAVCLKVTPYIFWQFLILFRTPTFLLHLPRDTADLMLYQLSNTVRVSYFVRTLQERRKSTISDKITNFCPVLEKKKMTLKRIVFSFGHFLLHLFLRSKMALIHIEHFTFSKVNS